MVLKAAGRGKISPFIVMEVMEAANARAAAGDDVFHLEVGQPGTGAPAGVLAAAKAALESDRLGYTEALGLPDLRRRIARHYQEYYGIDVAMERVVVTTGSSGAFLLSFLAAFDPGDRVALANPSYPAYRNILKALDITAVTLAADAGTRFQPTVDLLRGADGPLDGLIIASPSNPAGTMLDGAQLETLSGHCQAHGIRLISDEIYHGITYGRRAATMLAINNDAIVINSFSKYFSMTGWRLGWMVVPSALARAVECLTQNLFISPPTLSQLAAIAVFDCRDELDANVARYERNRALLLEHLPKAGFERLAPADGAFYLYADVTGLAANSEELCRRMLAETGVATTPGIDFDPERGGRYLRFSYAGSTADMEAAMARLMAWRRKM
ncbi:MAG: aminotransferase class I/II-fold pyridoxal phosphate-dependent enzyme [Alphaproteobacteria bacterium]